MHGTINNPFFCDAPRTGDPTGTFALRRRWKNELGRAWMTVQKAMRAALNTNDMLGLSSATSASLTLRMVGSLQNMGSGVKVKAFQSFATDTINQAILQGDGSYLEEMVKTAYMMGVKRAVRIAQLDRVPDELMPRIDHNIDAIVQLTMVEIQGIVDATVQQSVRAVAEGILRQDKAAVVTRAVIDRVRKIGVTRTTSLIDFIVVRAFNEATLDVFQGAKIAEVELVPETQNTAHVSVRHDHSLEDNAFDDASKKKGYNRTGAGSRISRKQQPSRTTVARIRRQEQRLEALQKVNVMTAGDDRVCPICEGISINGPYTIDRARSLIPAHARCRCAFVPANDKRFKRAA